MDSVEADHTWKTRAGGYEATITYCSKPACIANPYIKTNPNRPEQDNLENRPEC